MDARTQELAALRRKWLGRWPMGLYVEWRERRLAKRTSLLSLRVYREIEATQPEVSGIARYEEVIIRHTGLDREGARRLLRRAEDSFAAWPNERPVRFRDVVQYLVVDACLKADPSALGARSRLVSYVAAVIPADL